MTNDTLISLLLTLSPKEKAVFKRFASMNSENRILNYVVLFDIYNKLLSKNLTKEEWDKKLKSVLKKHPKISKNYANIRKRLKEKILESLVGDHLTKNDEMQAMLYLNILYERKLYSEVQSKINKLKKQAQIQGHYKILIEMIDWECEILRQVGAKNDSKKLAILSDQQDAYLDLYRLEVKLKSIYRQMSLILEMDLQLKKKENKQIFENLGNDPFLEKIDIEKHEADKNFKIVLWYYKIRNLYHRITGKLDLCYNESKKLVSTFEVNDLVKKNFEKEYIASLCSFTRACFRLKKREELGITLEKVQGIYALKNDFDTLAATCDMGIPHYLNTMQYEKAKELVQILSDRWDYIKQKVSDGKLLFYAYHSFLLYWVLDDQENLEKWTTVTLDYSRTKRAKGLYFITQIINLTREYDQQQFFHFTEKIETLKKTLQNNEHLKPFESIIFKNLRDLINIETGNRAINLNNEEKKSLIQNTFLNFKRELLNLKNAEEVFTKPTGFEEVKTWVESKIQQKSIREAFEDSLE